MKKSLKVKSDRSLEIDKRLKKAYPIAKCALNFGNAWELLVATILSAQCTDKRVNLVTPPLFERYGSISAFADADINDLEEMVRSTGFFRNKSKNIKAAAHKILDDFKGKVPDTMENLITVPGIARKSANVILFVWYGKNEGVVVDTHVKRVTFRLGLTKEKDPVKIEKDLMKLIPRKDWGDFAYRIVLLGRNLCKAPTPKCPDCFLKDICPSAKKFL